MGRRKRKFSTAVEKALRKLKQMQAQGLVVGDQVAHDEHESSLTSATTQSVVTPNLPSPQPKSESKPEPSRLSPPALERATLWRKEFFLLRDRFPSEARNRMSVRNSGFRITAFYADGTITGTYSDQAQAFNVYARPRNSSIGCSCRQSQGRFICEHNWAFVEKIIAELGTNGELVARINAGQFSEGSFDISHFQFDETNDLLHNLTSFLDVKPLDTDIALPPIETVQRERIGWQVSLRPDISLALIVQGMSKRGDRWRKGRTTSLQLLDSAVERTAADLAVLRILGQNASWNSTIQSQAAEALLCLIGQPNVIVDSDEYEVLAGNAVLKLIEVNGAWSVELFETATPSADLKIKFGRDGVVSIDSVKRQLYVTRLANSQVRCMQALIAIPPVRKPQHVQTFINRCQQLQSLANIILPEKFGHTIEEPVVPVFLLRYRPEGFLEYGIRLRDSQGKLHMPGEGTMISSTVENEQPIQHTRSAANERAVAQQLQTEFGLERGTIHGRVSFEQGLQLIEQLERRSGEIEVLWDEHTETPMRSLGTLTNKNLRVSISKKRDWFQLNGRCELDGGNIDLSELINSLSSSETESVGDYVKIGDHGWAKISEELKEGLQKLADAVNVERGQMKFDRTAAITMRELGESVTVDASQAWQQCLERLAHAEALEPEVPQALNAELRDYQADGFKWLRRLSEWGVGGVLADDMGLGKTVQTLAVLVDRAPCGPSLVIAPTSVGFNWLREIQRFAPQLNVHSYRDTDRNEFFHELGPGHIVVCSYGLALRDADKLAKVSWANLVLDEAQAIKNSQSKTSQAIASIEADWKVALTGTPVENHLGELWSLFHIISPGLFGGWEQFRRRFATPIEKHGDEGRRLALRERLKPFILRRTKREVLKDLPARTEQNLVVELSPAERQVYDKYRLSILDQANQIAKLPDIKVQRFKLLALLTRLRQIACHVRLVEDQWKPRSTKLESLLETLKDLREEGHRTLIFSQFVQHLQLIRTMLDEEKFTYQYLDGSTSPVQRQQQVDKFQNGDATAFLISLKAGGTGLNLTGADYVIHMDPWWNPAVEDQATDRAHRIGQTKPVMVYRLIAKNTIEEEILKLHEDKRDLVAGILDGTHAASSLSTEELIALLTK